MTDAVDHRCVQWAESGRKWATPDRRVEPFRHSTAQGGHRKTRSVMRATRPITASLAAVVAAGALAGPAGAMPIDPTKPEPTPDPTARPLASTPPHRADAPRSSFD